MSNKPRRSSDIPKAAVEALRHGNLIEAIKVVRQDRNIGLKEAKKEVEAYLVSQPALKKKMDKVLATAQQRFIRWLIGFLVLTAGMAYLVMLSLGSWRKGGRRRRVGVSLSRCKEFNMKSGGKLPMVIMLSLALYWALAPVTAMAKVQVLPETTLVVAGKRVTGQSRLLRHPVVVGLLAAFGRAETALKNEDIDALMQFYAPSYDYHGLKESDVRRVWGEVFEHYKAVESLHLFSAIKVSRVNDGLRAEVTCTGGLYGTDEHSGDRVTLDSWFREVHYLVKEGDAWRFLGNAGGVPTVPPFASAAHHPLF